MFMYVAVFNSVAVDLHYVFHLAEVECWCPVLLDLLDCLIWE